MRLRQLDVIRAVAVLLVLGRHMPDVPLGVWGFAGGFGVDLFFVLSGFLVSGLLFAEYRKWGDLRIGRFLVRRGMKIYPGFYAFLVFTLALALAKGMRVDVGNYLAEVFFVQNYVPGVFMHTWSLAVEEHFYLLLALGLLLVVRLAGPGSDPFARLPGVCLAICVAVLAYRVVAVATNMPSASLVEGKTNLRFVTHARVDSLLFGVILAYFHHFRPAETAAFFRRRKWIVVAVSALCLLPCCFVYIQSPLMSTVGWTAAYVGFGGVVCLPLHWSDREPKAPGLVARALSAVGRDSYSIYLWHVYGVEFARKLVPVAKARLGSPVGSAASVAAYVLASIALGMLAARIVERPALRLRDRLFPTRSATAVAAEPEPGEPEVALSASCDASS